MSMGLGLSLGLSSKGSSGSAFVAPTAPVFYDFIVGEGWGTGTALSVNGSNGFTTLQDLAGAGTNAAIKVNTTGGYMFGTAANQAWHAAKSITTGDGWVAFTMISTCNMEMHRSMVGSSDSFSGVRYVFGVGTVGLNVIQTLSNGTIVTQYSLANGSWVQAGDRFVFNTDSTGKRLIPYLNGRQLTLLTSIPLSGLDISALTLTGQHGLRGNASTTGAIEDMEFGDATMGQMRLYMPTRVLQREPNGDVIFKVAGNYTKSTPAALKYNIVTSAKVAVQTAQPLLSPVIAGGSYSGLTTAFTPVAATSYMLTVYRDDAVSGGIIRDHSGYVLPGECPAAWGQSNVGNFYAASLTTTAYTPPANCFTIQAANSNLAEGDIVYAAFTTVNSAIASMLGTLSTDYGVIPTCLVEGGLGATSLEERCPVSFSAFGGANQDIFYSFQTGVKIAGYGLRYMNVKEGESNANFNALSAGNPGNTTSYPITFALFRAAMDTYNGRNFVYLMSPVGSYSGSGITTAIAQWEAMRRAQYKLANDNPGAIVISSLNHDLQHLFSGAVVNDLHYTSDSYAIWGRRQAKMQAYLDGLSAYHLLGPSMVSAVKHSNTEVDITFNLNTLDSLTVMNAVGGSDCRAGLRFSTTAGGLASGAGGDLSCTTVPAVQSTTATTETWRFTMTASTAGTIYVGGPGGQNPFNPTNNNTVNLNFRTQAVIFAGVKTSELNVGLQPYYDFATNNDYLAAT